MTSASSTLTTEQGRAIELRDVSVALSAGAGCGKTFVLTERFLSYFHPDNSRALQPEQLHQLVAITFTDRAAREMRDRIRRKCHERLMAAEGEAAARYWTRLARGLDAARVSTIHSFCGNLLRAHAVEAQLDPQFSVLEQSQAETLLAELIDDALRELLAERDEATLDLLVRFGLDRLRDMLSSAVGRHSLEQLQAWLERSVDEQLAAWQEYHHRQVIPAALHRVVHSRTVQQLLPILRQQPPANATMQQRCQALLEILLPWLGDSPACKDPAGAMEAIHEHARVQGGGGKKAWESEETYETVKNCLTALRDLAAKVSQHLGFDPAAARPAAVAGQQVLQIAAGIARLYAARKQELGVLDFNDLLSRARQLLTHPEHQALRKRLCAQIQLLLVDEFQDTDPTQVELVSALCGDGLFRGKLFFVGDYKQSIYRFRGANPRVFRELRSSIPEAGRLPLTLNFRSQPEILHFVNALFCDELGPEYEALRPNRPQVTPSPTIEFLWARAEEDKEEKESKESLRRREADWIARRLRVLLDSQEPIVWDQQAAAAGRPAARPAQPGDIALLFRALSNVEYYEDALRRHGIDYYLVGGHAFYAQQEIFDLLNLLRAVASPADMVSLAGALRSPFFALTDETLFWLCQHAEGLAGGLFAAPLPRAIVEDQRQRVAFAAATIRDLRRRKDQVRIADLINEALSHTGYDAVLLAEFLGERKLANLRKLIDQARSFERGGMFTLTDFIDQLAGFVAKQPDEPLAATHPEATNVVRLMTIHQSKGLEFPIVVVPDLDRATHSQSSPLEFTQELGPLVKLPAQSAGGSAVSGYDLYTLVEAEEAQAELNRLLYVATTRAADYLILSSGVESLGSAKSPWMQLLSRRFDLLSGKVNRALPSGWPTPAVKVTVECPEVPKKPARRRARRDLGKIIATLESTATGEARVSPYSGPVPPDPTARRQYSFSRLTGKLHVRPAELPADDTEQNRPEPLIDPRGLGTLVHAALAELRLQGPLDLGALVRRQADKHLIHPNGEIAEAMTMLERFRASHLAAELAQATEDYNELEFLLGWPPEKPTAGGIYLTGFIDRLYRDGDGSWHLVDFKTNRVSRSSLKKVAAEYEMQMLVYALAAETVLGQSPATLRLHFLRTGDEHLFAWDATARERVRWLVDAGIAAACSAAGQPVQ